MTCEIKSIKIKFKDTEIEGTLEELKELKYELEYLFKKEFVYPYNPVYPTIKPYYSDE